MQLLQIQKIQTIWHVWMWGILGFKIAKPHSTISQKALRLAERIPTMNGRSVNLNVQVTILTYFGK